MRRSNLPIQKGIASLAAKRSFAMTNQFIMEPVECLASDSYPGTPRAVMWEGVRRAVAVILRRWRDPNGLGYCIRTTDGLTLDLFYDLHADAWRVSLTGERSAPDF